MHHLAAVEIQSMWPDTRIGWIGSAAIDWKLLVNTTVRVVLAARASWVSVAAACNVHSAIKMLLMQQNGEYAVHTLCVRSATHHRQVRVTLARTVLRFVQQAVLLDGMQSECITMPNRHTSKSVNVRLRRPTLMCSMPGCTAPRQFGHDCFAHGMAAPAASLANN